MSAVASRATALRSSPRAGGGCGILGAVCLGLAGCHDHGDGLDRGDVEDLGQGLVLPTCDVTELSSCLAEHTAFFLIGTGTIVHEKIWRDVTIYPVGDVKLWGDPESAAFELIDAVSVTIAGGLSNTLSINGAKVAFLADRGGTITITGGNIGKCGTGVYMRGTADRPARLYLQDASVTDSTGNGIVLMGKLVASIRGSTSSWNQYVGLWAGSGVSLEVDESTFDRNRHGGLYTRGAATITRSVFSDNVGFGLYAHDASLTILDSFFMNTVRDSLGVLGYGLVTVGVTLQLDRFWALDNENVGVLLADTSGAVGEGFLQGSEHCFVYDTAPPLDWRRCGAPSEPDCLTFEGCGTDVVPVGDLPVPVEPPPLP